MTLVTSRRLAWIGRISLFALGIVLGLALPIAAFAQTISAGTTGTAFSATTASTPYILNLGDVHTFTGTSEAVTFGGTTGSYNLTINGSLIANAAASRGVRGANNNVTFNLTVGNAGLIQAFGEDAIQARNGTFNLTNNGTIYSGSNIGSTPGTAIATGQALDFASAVGGTVTNNGLIRADGHDAVRLGNNTTMTNTGTVRTNGVVNDNSSNNVFNSAPNNSVAQNYSANDGVSFENGSNSSLTNSGLISGSRHGVETDVSATNITLTNQASGQIIGRNGSGFGSDATSATVSNITVNNSGLIRGDFAGVGNVVDRTGAASPTQDGDGDGVDIDGAGTVNNYAGGQILGTGANGYDTGGRANTADGISLGGGIINNSGLIRGAGVGIVVNNDTTASRSGVAATTITNNAGGTIEGQSGYAIRLESKLGDARDNDTIINDGTIIGNGSIPNPGDTVTIQGGATDTNSTGTLNGVTYTGTGSARFIRGDGAAIQMGEGNDTLTNTNTGTITGNSGRAVSFEGGNDTLNYNGGQITGTIDGGVGTNTLNLGNGVNHASATQNFQNVNVASGSATLAGVVSGSSLTKTGSGWLTLTAANTYTGPTTVAAGVLLVNNTSGSGTGTGAVTVAANAGLGGSGIISGVLTVNGQLDPGANAIGIGTLTTLSDVIWNGSSSNPWIFDLGGGTLSDRLNVGGDFIKGSGNSFEFDFGGTNLSGSYVLIDWNGTTNFTANDFLGINAAPGQTGTFWINGSQLEFTTFAPIPEPSAYAALMGLGTLGLVAWRRRNKTG